MKKNHKQLIMTVCAAMTACGAIGTGAFASSNSSDAGFVARYNQNAQIEAGLLAKAQAGVGTSGATQQYATAVQTINQQIVALFGAEQTLANEQAALSTLPAVSSQTDKLNHEEAQLDQEIENGNHGLSGDGKHHSKDWKRNEKLQIRIWKLQEEKVKLQLSEYEDAWSSGDHRSYANGLKGLQESIFNLQSSAIHYTNQWIAAEGSSSSTGNAASITGLSYTQSTITAPAAGTQAVTDVVYSWPVVKDSNGNVIQNAGTYTLNGPTGATGVSIDGHTGTVIVIPGATPGQYTSTYSQNNVTDSVYFNVYQPSH
jgi:hypothetical protein